MALVEARLFVSDLAAGTPVFGVAHEALLRRWPRIGDWIATHRDALRVRARLAQQALRWDAEGRPSDLLLPRGKPLDEARGLQRSSLWSLSAAEQDLIGLSARKARRFEWLRLSALGLIIVLAILDSALALHAYQAKRSAEARRIEMEGMVDFMLGDFADKLRPLGKLDLLDSVSGKSLEYLRGSQNDELSPAGLTLRARALQVIAEVSRARGDAGAAIDALNQANAILVRQHGADPRQVPVLENLGINAYWIGQLHKDRNDLASAETAWRQYLQFADRLHALEPGKVAWWIEQSYAHNNLGSLAQARGQPALAAAAFTASIALKRRALQHAGDDSSLTAELADSYAWLASARQSQGQLQEAGRLQQLALELVRGLRARFPGEAMWVNREVHALQQRATLLLALGEDDAAYANTATAAALLAKVARDDPQNRRWQVELANIELDLLKLKARRQPPATLLPEFARVHATLEAAHRLDPRNAQWATSEAVARGKLGAALLAAGDSARAQQESAVALERLRRLQAAGGASQVLRLALVEALLSSAAVQQALGDAQGAQAICRQAIGLIEPDMATMDFEVLDPWARVTLCLQEAGDTRIPWRRLQQVGYRDSVYRQLIVNHHRKPHEPSPQAPARP